MNTWKQLIYTCYKLLKMYELRLLFPKLCLDKNSISINIKVHKMKTIYTNILQQIHVVMYIACIIMLSYLTSCSHSVIISNADTTIQGIPCKGELHYDKNKHLQSCTLARDYVWEGLTIPAGSQLIVNESGKIAQFIVGKEAIILGQVYPAKTHFFLHFWGQDLSFWLPVNTNIQGFEIAESHDGQGTPVYANGKLKEFWLIRDTIIEGIPCSTSANLFKYGMHVISLGTERRVKFHANGHLQRAMISKDITIQNQVFHTGDFINLDENGQVIKR